MIGLVAVLCWVAFGFSSLLFGVLVLCKKQTHPKKRIAMYQLFLIPALLDPHSFILTSPPQFRSFGLKPQS